MKLLLDQNLSHRLKATLASAFPGITHVRDFGMALASDDEVWERAKRDGLTIVSKDVDFNERGILFGHPPKVIWIRRGNCSTRDISDLLIAQRGPIERFHSDDQAGVLELY